MAAARGGGPLHIEKIGQMMKEIHAGRWKKVREAGLAQWMIRRGVLGFGVAMLVMFMIPRLNDPAHLVHSLIVYVPLCLSGGALFGLATWYPMEWQYRRYVTRHGVPHT